jgi:hypothetical protein
MNPAALSSAQADVARAERWLADLDRRRVAALEKTAELEQEIASAPDYLTATDARERDRRHDRLVELRQRLALLRSGRLLYAPEQAYERVEDLDALIRHWTAKREAAEARRVAAEQLVG